jgi:hypothetical protein
MGSLGPMVFCSNEFEANSPFRHEDPVTIRAIRPALHEAASNDHSPFEIGLTWVKLGSFPPFCCSTYLLVF